MPWLLMLLIGVCSTSASHEGLPSTVESTSHLLQCCSEQRVTSLCQDALCGGVAPVTALPLTCYNDIGKMLRCLAGLRNASSCCLRRGIPSQCASLCNGNAMELVMDGIACFGFMSSVTQCYDEEYANLPDPPTSLTIENVTCSSVGIRWFPPILGNSTRLSYAIEYRRHGSFSSQQVSTNKLSYSIYGLSPAALYDVYVTSVSLEGCSRPTSPATFLTYPESSGQTKMRTKAVVNNSGESEPVQLSLSLVNSTAFTLTVSWTCLSTDKLISMETIRYRRHDKLDWTSIIVGVTPMCRGLTVQNLQPDTQYDLQVSQCSSAHVCPYVSSVIEVATSSENLTKSLALHGNISDCCHQNNVSSACSSVCHGSDAIDLRKCANDLGKIIFCTASVQDNKDHSMCCQRMNIPSVCLSFCSGDVTMVTDLPTLLCMSFIEEIFTCLQNEIDNLPEAPTDFQIIELGPTYATFSWLMSEHSSELSYRLHYSTVLPSGDSGRDVVVEALSSPFRLDGLTPSCEYVVYLVSVNGEATSDPAPSIMYRTHHDASQLIQIHQSPLGYSAAGSQVILECSDLSAMKHSSANQVYWVKDQVKVEGTLYVIENVQPEDNGRYTCIVQFEGGHFESAEAIVRVQFAPEVLPGENHVTAAANHTGHLVCRFTGYPDLISWYRSDSLSPISGPRFSTTRYLHEEIGVVDVQLSVENVSRDDYGVYRCEGRNVYGSAASYVWLTDVDITSVRAFDTAYNDDIPNVPDNVRVSLTELGHVFVSWDVTSLPANLFYRVLCASDLHEISSQTVHSRNAVLSDVMPYTKYNITVVTGNQRGTSRPSPPVYISTYEIAPSAPRKVSAYVIDDVTVRVTWSPPEFHANYVAGYYVYFAPASQPGVIHQMRSVEPERNEYLFRELESQTLYSFYVTSKSQHYESQPSIRIYAQTRDYGQLVPTMTFGYRHQVTLAVGLSCVLVAGAITLAIILFFYSRKTKHKARWSSSLENPSYSGLEDGQLVSEGSADGSDRPVSTLSGRESTTLLGGNAVRLSSETDSSVCSSDFHLAIVNSDVG